MVSHHLQRVLDDVESDGFPPTSRVAQLRRWSFNIVFLIVRVWGCVFVRHCRRWRERLGVENEMAQVTSYVVVGILGQVLLCRKRTMTPSRKQLAWHY